MDTYISNLYQSRRIMEKADPGSKLSDKAFGVRMLKQSGLLAEEKGHALASTASDYDVKKVETALRNMFRDAAKNDRVRTAQMQKQREFYQRRKCDGKGQKGKTKHDHRKEKPKGGYPAYSA